MYFELNFIFFSSSSSSSCFSSPFFLFFFYKKNLKKLLKKLFDSAMSWVSFRKWITSLKDKNHWIECWAEVRIKEFGMRRQEIKWVVRKTPWKRDWHELWTKLKRSCFAFVLPGNFVTCSASNSTSEMIND